MYFIDANILIGFLRGKNRIAYELLSNSDASMFKIPALVAAELYVDAEKSSSPEDKRFKVDSLLLPYEIVPFDSQCAAEYAKVRAYLENEGMKIGGNDLLIAATALAHSATLVTNNVKEFKRIPWLSLESWEEVDL